MRHDIAKLIIILSGLGINVAHAGNEHMGSPLTSLIQPGFYGLVDIEGGPLPPVVYAQPVLVSPPAQSIHAASIYLHVPPSHAKNWVKYCHEYNACSQPVYFVRSGEYIRDQYYAHQEHEHDYDNYRYDDRHANKNP